MSKYTLGFEKSQGKLMKIGYARVSTHEQNTSMQRHALKQAGCEKIFTDTASGVRTDRPGLENAFNQLRAGDVLVVWKLDRLGRSLQHLIETIKSLQEKKIGFQSLQENIDTVTSGGKLIFHIFSALAEFERDVIRERTKAGLVAARARGRVGGRPALLAPKQIARVKKLYDARKNTVEEICKIFTISRPTFYNYINQAMGKRKKITTKNKKVLKKVKK